MGDRVAAGPPPHAACGRIRAVANHPDPAELYPEVATAGSLAAALRLVAAAQGLSFPVREAQGDPMRAALVPTTLAHRRELEVGASHVERRWFVRARERDQDLSLLGGDTEDLSGIVRAAHAWHDGAPLDEIAEVAPFLRLTGRFEVPDGDPVLLAESEWWYLRAHAAEEGTPEYRALIEAAYAEPVLRRLYPFTSHWALRFSTTTRPALSHEVAVCLFAGREHDYSARMNYLGPVVGRAATAQELVALAVRHVPAGLGPVRSGARERS